METNTNVKSNITKENQIELIISYCEDIKKALEETISLLQTGALAKFIVHDRTKDYLETPGISSMLFLAESEKLPIHKDIQNLITILESQVGSFNLETSIAKTRK